MKSVSFRQLSYLLMLHTCTRKGMAKGVRGGGGGGGVNVGSSNSPWFGYLWLAWWLRVEM